MEAAAPHPTTAGPLQAAGHTVEEVVQRLWQEHPGAGVKELVAGVCRLLPDAEEEARISSAQPGGTASLKQRVKAAKEALPYGRSPDAPDAQSGFAKESMVRTLLEQRQSHRAVRQWARADALLQGLEGMGITVDDTLKTWTLGAIPEQRARVSSQPPEEQLVGGVPCGMCGRQFGSRNLVFKHLKDPANGCGLTVSAEGGIDDAPSTQAKAAAKVRARLLRNRAHTGATARHAAAESCLWLGNIPLKWSQPAGKYKRLEALLYSCTPREVPRPWIKRVVRKAYRAAPSLPVGEGAMPPDTAAADGRQQQQAEEGGLQQQQQEGPYLGYAIVCYRDAAEAAAVLAVMDGLVVCADTVYGREPAGAAQAGMEHEPPFVLKVRAAEHGDSKAAVAKLGGSATEGCAPKPGLDPPLLEQLRPLSVHALQERLTWLRRVAAAAAAAQADDAPPEAASALGLTQPV